MPVPDNSSNVVEFDNEMSYRFRNGLQADRKATRKVTGRARLLLAPMQQSLDDLKADVYTRNQTKVLENDKVCAELEKKPVHAIQRTDPALRRRFMG